MSLTAFAVRRPVTTVAATLGVILLGSVSVTKLPVSLLPDVELPVLTIRTTYPGVAATEVSRFVAEPIEKAVAATPGIVELRSVSRNNEVTTTIHFAWGTDMQKTVLNIRERLDNARPALGGAGRPTLLTSDPGERPIAVLAVTSKATLSDLAHLSEDVHSRRLEQLEGVASVAVVGSPRDEIEVRVDPERLRAMAISAQDVGSAIAAANAQGSGGTIRRGQFRYSVRALTELTSPEELLDTPIGSSRGMVHLRDIAEVAVTTAPPLTVTRLGGKPAIGLVIYKDAGSNTVSVTDRMMEAVEQLKKDYPTVDITVVAAQAQFVTDALSNLWQEVWLGGLLSILVPLLFLRDVRSSIAIAMMLPLSVLVALVLLRGLNVTVNILSLGGLALGCGLLIDNAIVVAEAAAARKKETGESREDATINATAEVSGPLIAGTLTTLLVFGPIIFVKGLAAALFRDLSWSVVMSVAGSLVLALTLMPVMIVGRRSKKRIAHADHPGEQPGDDTLAQGGKQADNAFLRWSDRVGARSAHLYEAGMAWALDHRAAVMLATVVTVGVLIPVVMATPREILPRVDEGTVIGTLKLQEGTSLEETIRQVSRIEGVALAFGSTKSYARVGLATDEEILGGSEPGSSATAQIIIPAPDGKTAVQVSNEIRRRLPDLAEAGYLSLDVAGQSEFGALTGREGRLVKVEVQGPTYAASQKAADVVREKIAKLSSLSDVRNAFATTQPVIEIQSERDRIAEHGLTPRGVADAMSGALGGLGAGDLRQTDRRTPISIRYQGSSNEDLDAGLATAIAGIPVSQLVTVKEARAPIEVVRVHQRPVTIIEGSIERGGTAKAVRDVQQILNTIEIPGVTFQITGADIEQRKTTEQLSFVAILSAALMFLVLAGEFASFTLPIVVMLTVPLAAVGSLFLLFFTGQSINAVSLIGIVVMIGMADNEAVVKVDAIRRFRDMGHSVREAVMLGGRQRLRAIVMTSLTTVTGVLPLMFGVGGGGALYRPLAAAVIGGAISSILVTFFVLPVAYTILEERAERRARIASPAAGPSSPVLLGIGSKATEPVA